MDALSRGRGRPPRGQAPADLLPADGPVWTTAHVAAFQGVDERTVRRAAARGDLHHLRLTSRVLRFSRPCLMEHLHGRSCAGLVYDEEILDAEQAAALLGVGMTTLLRAAAAGVIPGRHLAGTWRFSRAALLRCLCPEPPAAG
ncbi:helix-turn-helix domain-containing protein [Planomonospora sp. ID91781]|uniref:helix-turn-helix domain-containing protein n=1 Tax=Planomonospora sp. ID91781 TaxID=2738135 RepID=UPI0018C40AC9|nr:helix-turn-helix domain-containing protein [Planomonospora sp. ID91781]MBG0825816.1 helix-turn-helix domain-containing protein [Planomonospora sp. ID91781]